MDDWYKEFLDRQYKDYDLDISKAIDPAGYELFVRNQDVEPFIHGRRSPGLFGRNNVLTPIYTKQKLKYDEIYFRINPEGLTLIKGDDGKFHTLSSIKSENILQGYSLTEDEYAKFSDRYKKDIKTFERNLETIENRKFFQSLREMFNAEIYDYFDRSVFMIQLTDKSNYLCDAFKVYCAICGYDVDRHWDKFCIKKHKPKDITKKVKESKHLRFLTSQYEIDNTRLKSFNCYSCLKIYSLDFIYIRSFFNFKDTNKMFLFYESPYIGRYIEDYKHLIPMSNRLDKVNWRIISEYFDYNIEKEIDLRDYKGKIYSTGIDGIAYIEGETTE